MLIQTSQSQSQSQCDGESLPSAGLTMLVLFASGATASLPFFQSVFLMNLDRFLPLVFGLHCFAAMGGTADVFRVSQLSSSDLSEPVSVKTLWGEVQRPSLPTHVCTVLPARLTPKHGSIDALDANPKVSKPDTKRLQDAIDDCPAGSAVKLVIDSHRKSGF